MLDILEAQAIAENCLKEIMMGSILQVEINFSITEEYPVGYVFFYNTREFWETRDFTKSLVGNGPILVRSSGEVVILPSHQSVKRSLEELEDS